MELNLGVYELIGAVAELDLEFQTNEGGPCFCYSNEQLPFYYSHSGNFHWPGGAKAPLGPNEAPPLKFCAKLDLVKFCAKLRSSFSLAAGGSGAPAAQVVGYGSSSIDPVPRGREGAGYAG